MTEPVTVDFLGAGGLDIDVYSLGYRRPSVGSPQDGSFPLVSAMLWVSNWP